MSPGTSTEDGEFTHTTITTHELYAPGVTGGVRSDLLGIKPRVG